MLHGEVVPDRFEDYHPTPEGAYAVPAAPAASEEAAAGTARIALQAIAAPVAP